MAGLKQRTSTGIGWVDAPLQIEGSRGGAYCK